MHGGRESFLIFWKKLESRLLSENSNFPSRSRLKHISVFHLEIGEIKEVGHSRRAVSLRLDLLQTSGPLDSYVMSS